MIKSWPQWLKGGTMGFLFAAISLLPYLFSGLWLIPLIGAVFSFLGITVILPPWFINEILGLRFITAGDWINFNFGITGVVFILVFWFSAGMVIWWLIRRIKAPKNVGEKWFWRILIIIIILISIWISKFGYALPSFGLFN